MPGGAALLISALPVVTFLLVAIAELLRPRRPLQEGRLRRWVTHGLLFALNRGLLWAMGSWVTVPLAALWAQANGFGLLRWIEVPAWIEVVIAFILLDFALWAQHLAMHRFAPLWRMHAVHHADRDLDATTAIRFHPFEILVSTVWKAGCVALLGVPLIVALAFEAWLSANAMFNHGNVELPRGVDRIVRKLLITPDMHLVHHSTLPGEQRHNYGFALTLWDRLFGTYQPESQLGQSNQPIGLAEAQDDRPATLLWSLKLPLT